jgi:hypothetical protein
MCGNDGIFHGPITKARITLPFSGSSSHRGIDPFHSGGAGTKASKLKKNGPKLTPAEEAAQAEAQAAQDANMQVAATRRRRLRASLFAGGRSVLGAPAGAGGAPAGGGSPVTSSAVAGGSAMGGGSRSYGGGGGFAGSGARY